MRSVRMVQACTLLVVAAVSSAAAGRTKAMSIEQVGAAYDRTEEVLENLENTARSGDWEATRAVLNSYLRSLSTFHTTLVRQRPERQEREFLKTLIPRLGSQISATRALAEIAQPPLKAVLNEAANHLQSALGFVDHTANRNRGLSVKVAIRGPESTNPGARSWPPYLLFGAAEPQSRSR